MVETEKRVNMILQIDNVKNMPKIGELQDFLDNNEVEYLGLPKCDTNDTKAIVELAFETHEAAIEAIGKLQGKKISTDIKGQKYEFDVTAELYREESTS